MIKIIHKMLSFFDAKDKKMLLFLLVGFLLVGFVEMACVASIAPFVAVVSHPELIHSNQYLSMLYHFLALGSEPRFMAFLGVTVFAFVILGNIFSATMLWLLMRFSFFQGGKLSTRLLKQYLLEPYVFYLNKNRSEMTKVILSDVFKVILGILINGMQAITKLIVIGCIFVLLLYVDPVLAISVCGVLGGAYVGFYLLFSKKMAATGAFASYLNAKQYQIVNETLGAIKELRVLKREASFLAKFRGMSEKYAKAESVSLIIPQLTRYTVEAIAFAGILLIVLYLMKVKADISQLLPLLALYALAGYRLLPPMQQVFTGLSLVKYNAESLQILDDAMKQKHLSLDWQNKSVQRLHFNTQIELQDISFSYPYASKSAISNVNIQIPKNTSIGLVGMTGSGKTTTVDIILGLLAPSNGQIVVDGQAITSNQLDSWQQNLGYVPQTIYLTDDSVANNIAIGIPAELIDREALIRAAKLANLHEFIVNEMTDGYDTFVGEGGIRLSGGQRQRIGIARALYHDPEVLIFDEATSALDGDTEQVIIKSIKELAKQKTIIIIAHRLTTVKDCKTIYFFEKGRIVDEGTYESLVANNSKFRKIANLA